ncbi:MAG: hypothetical protein CSA22_10380 [Deltaproteobacteria bacterium]|nr:MAG: hypothetical protein CSA22_10380 [Deltaproteobacteria bacterium]
MKQKVGLQYIIFYILFLPDTWQLLMGAAISALVSPQMVPGDVGTGGQVVLYFMVATIGYAATGVPGRWISDLFKNVILGDNRPGL